MAVRNLASRVREGRRRRAARLPVRVAREGNLVAITFHGRLDALHVDAAPWDALVRRVSELRAAHVTVDTAAVTFIDSASYARLRGLLAALRGAAPRVSFKPGRSLARLCALRREDIPGGTTLETAACRGPSRAAASPRRTDAADDGRMPIGAACGSAQVLGILADWDPPAPDAVVPGSDAAVFGSNGAVPEEDAAAGYDVRLSSVPEDGDDVFVVDLDFESRCLAGDGGFAEADPLAPLTFQTEVAPHLIAVMKDDDAAHACDPGDAPTIVSGTEAWGPVRDVRSPVLDWSAMRRLLEDAAVSPENPATAAQEQPPAPAAADLEGARHTVVGEEAGLRGDLKDRMLEALLESDRLRRENEQLRARMAESAAACEAMQRERAALACRLDELHAVWDGYDLNPLLLGEEAWRELGPALDALAAGFKRELRVAPDALRRVAARLVELAAGEPLAAYGPVFPPGGGASEPAVCAAMAAALGPALGYRGRQAEDAVVVCLLAALYGADAMRPADHDAAVRSIARLLGELRGGGEAPADTVRRYMAQTLCVRRFTRAVAVEGLEVSEAIAALMAGERRESVETLAAFVRTFGLCPRGSWVRLTDGTLGCVVGPARGAMLVVRSYAECAGRVVRLTPAPVVAGAGRRIDIAGPVHEPCGYAVGAATQGRGAGRTGDRQVQHG